MSSVIVRTVILHPTNFPLIILVLPIALNQSRVLLCNIMSRRTKPKQPINANRDTVQRLVRWSREIDEWLENTAPKEGLKTRQDKVRKVLFEARKAEMAEAA